MPQTSPTSTLPLESEKLQTVELSDYFYRDSFKKLLAILISLIIAIAFLIAASCYLYFTKPKPIMFPIGSEWRVLQPVPINQPYLSTPDLLQWVSEAFPAAFLYDFNNYNEQLKKASRYFTPDGWKAFLNQLNTYANYNNVQTYKLFVSGAPASAPFILNQGLLSGTYGWWVQMPIDISYAGFRPPAKQRVTFQVLIVRVPTTNNLSGVGINNVIVMR